jgi:ATP-dependent DNA helicase UvrD/PcrA
VIRPALNEAQRAAVEHRGGPTMVLAGAGSGKTRVLTARLAHMVSHHDIPPYRILACTFTNRAAQEMRRRVGELLGREPTGLWIGTFHSLCARLLRREAAFLGFTPQFTIYDETDQLNLIKRLLEAGGYPAKQFPPRLIRSLISSAKNRLVFPEEYAAAAVDRIEQVAAEIYREVTLKLAAQNAMDFDDLLIHPLTLFREQPERLAVYQERFQSVLVDEFQDTNRAQYLFVNHLAARHRELCVVGDDDQSIYGWRGADVRNMLDFTRDYPDAQTFRLEENYRSTQLILDAANGVIAANHERLGKTLFTTRQGGEPVTLVATADERDEAEWIAREIRERTAGDLYTYADVSILYRTNSQSRALEDAFRRTAIPYRVVGSVSFYARREVRDLVAYLRLIANPADDEAFIRAVQVPKRGLGRASLATLQAKASVWNRSLLDTASIADRIRELRPRAQKAFQQFADLVSTLGRDKDETTPAAILERLIEAIEYDRLLQEEGLEGADRMENVRELVSSAAEVSEEVEADDPATPLERFLSTAALTTSDEIDTGDAQGVTLMTVHTAKGLEWPVVFVAGLEDGLFPLSRSMETPEGEEEERRLAYVAITRAQDRVYLTWAKSRRRNGQLLPSMSSRFLQAIPPEVVEERRSSGVFGGDLYRRSSRRQYAQGFSGLQTAAASTFASVSAPEDESQDSPRYIKGERVRHRTFGSGVIRGLSGTGRDLKVIVEFDEDDAGTKQLLVAYAGLERDWDPA